ncbi:MAG: sigma-54 dependent transcriptional regulator [Candidatus Solibacter sp.]
MAADPDSTVTLVAIDDDQESLDLVKDALAALEGLQVLTAPHPEEGLRLVQRHHPEIVLLDLIMPGLGGMELLDRILAFAPSTDVLLITGHYSTESAVEAIQKGASDYLNKPLSISVLRQRVGKLLEDAKRRQMSRRLGADLARVSQFEGMVGTSPLMLEVFAQIRRVAPHFRSALITGATGTGKDLVSRALHCLSPACSGNFVVCNASAVVETLFESELFGHVRGAFTGATQDKMGLFEHAHGGTLFLDEIGDMPLSTQAKLLRAVQNQEVQRVGSLTVRKVDVRVVAATNRDLRAMIAERQFREDLFYRLSMVQVKLPRLAERREDILLLARQFVERCAADYNKPLRGLTSRAEIALARYSWPGNVRELENVIANACMMAEGEFVDARDLPSELSNPTPAAGIDDDEMLPLSEVERRHAQKVLNRLHGNKTQAARILGINRATLHRLLEQADASIEAAGQ